jgi:hypothetical protein
MIGLWADIAAAHTHTPSVGDQIGRGALHNGVTDDNPLWRTLAPPGAFERPDISVADACLPTNHPSNRSSGSHACRDNPEK